MQDKKSFNFADKRQLREQCENWYHHCWGILYTIVEYFNNNKGKLDFTNSDDYLRLLMEDWSYSYDVKLRWQKEMEKYEAKK